MTASYKSFLSRFFHAPSRGAIEHQDKALICVGEDGLISDVLRQDVPGYADAVEREKALGSLIELPGDQFLLPGFVDLHIHAPQWPQLGKALDVPLEVWLQKHTFPLETKYQDLAFAQRVYADLVTALLANGTTTAVYFATIHQAASRALADICIALGQRAVVGKVAMDNRAECPDIYCEHSAQASIAGTRDFITYVRDADPSGRVQPCVTPRFIPSCSDEALEGLGSLAAETGAHVQTHCSESDWEHGYVLDRCGKTDTHTLDDFGLLTRKTVLAHSNFINDDDMELIKERGSGVAHCPLSNYFFSDAAFPLRRALEKGVRVGLGTDISGGPSASLIENARSSVSVARALEHGMDPALPRDERGVEDSRVDFRDAFYIATAGGADVLDIPAGRFEVGYHFDAIAIDLNAEAAPVLLYDQIDSHEDVLQKTIMLATRANIAAVWVGGQRVSGN